MILEENALHQVIDWLNGFQKPLSHGKTWYVDITGYSTEGFNYSYFRIHSFTTEFQVQYYC